MKKIIKKNNIILTSGKNHGQKKQEVFNSKNEIVSYDKFDKKINYINLNYIFKYDKFLYDIQKFQNMNLLRNKIKKSFRGYINSNVSRVSKSY